MGIFVSLGGWFDFGSGHLTNTLAVFVHRTPCGLDIWSEGTRALGQVQPQACRCDASMGRTERRERSRAHGLGSGGCFIADLDLRFIASPAC